MAIIHDVFKTDDTVVHVETIGDYAVSVYEEIEDDQYDLDL